MKRILGFVVTMMMHAITCANSVAVFISFSIPEPLLGETLQDTARFNIPAYLNGFYHNSMPATAAKIMELSKRIPNLQLQIDPTAFEKFEINQVPALVVENNGKWDVIYGHLSLQEGLQRIANSGESADA